MTVFVPRRPVAHPLRFEISKRTNTVSVISSRGHVIATGRSVREAKQELAVFLAELRAWEVVEEGLEQLVTRTMRLRGFDRRAAVQFLREVMSLFV